MRGLRIERTHHEARAINTLIADTHLRIQLAEKARRRALKLSVDATVDGYLQLYQDVCAPTADLVAKASGVGVFDAFLEPGREILVAKDGEAVAGLLAELDDARCAGIGRAARQRVLGEHTYAHRAEEVERVLGSAPRSGVHGR